MDFHESWHFLNEHVIFNDHFEDCLCIEVVKVHPKTKRIHNDENLNTETNVWLECGPLELCEVKEGKRIVKSPIFTHDIKLDCGGKTFEEAIVKLAKLVKKHYGSEQIDWDKMDTNVPISQKHIRKIKE